MAYLAVVGSAHVNGVAAIHSEIVKNEIFTDFYKVRMSAWPWGWLFDTRDTCLLLHVMGVKIVGQGGVDASRRSACK